MSNATRRMSRKRKADDGPASQNSDETLTDDPARASRPSKKLNRGEAIEGLGEGMKFFMTP